MPPNREPLGAAPHLAWRLHAGRCSFFGVAQLVVGWLRFIRAVNGVLFLKLFRRGRCLYRVVTQTVALFSPVFFRCHPSP
jgi:hypothetical protein